MTVLEQRTMESVCSINRKMVDQNDINWEQRRYEITREVLTYCAKELVDALNSGLKREEWVGKTIQRIASESAVRYADTLIEQLKRKEV